MRAKTSTRVAVVAAALFVASFAQMSGAQSSGAQSSGAQTSGAQTSGASGPDSAPGPGNARVLSSVEWVLPVERPVVDLFRPPSTPWGPGNRGWEFASVPGDPVVAVGSGVVVFAGDVAGRGVVTLAHPQGLLSSVTGLSAVTVGRGELVAAGKRIGTAAARLHLGFRRNGVYIDPASIYGSGQHAVLVPVPP
jgi:murein DD-endopeptidase MepM/ murein hydrolase activator NlpD